MSNPFEAPTSLPVVDVVPHLSPVHVLLSFDGRIARRHYWYGNFFIFAYTLVAVGVPIFLFPDSETAEIAMLFLFIPTLWMRLALMVKRFHDLGHSGFMVFCQLIPMVGGLIVFVMCGLTQGNKFPNDYGPELL